MLKDVMNAIIARLSAEPLAINQVAPYEGQFEDISEFVIVPPSAFIAVDKGTNEQQSTVQHNPSISVYLCTNYIQGTSQDGMLDLIDSVVDALHNTAIRGDYYVGRCFYKGFNWLGIFPGFCVYQLFFNIIQ